MDLFEALARQHSGAAQSIAPVPASAYLSLLTSAADRWTAQEQGALTGWLPLPAVTKALAAFDRMPDPEGVVRDILGLPTGSASDDDSDSDLDSDSDAESDSGFEAPVGEREWSRTLWAQVRTEQLLPAAGMFAQDPGQRTANRASFAQRMLGLPQPDANRFAEAVAGLRKALAAGRDPRNIHELASHRLERAGALSGATLRKDRDGRQWGRLFHQREFRPGGFDAGTVTLLERKARRHRVPGIRHRGRSLARGGRPEPLRVRRARRRPVRAARRPGLPRPGTAPARRTVPGGLHTRTRRRPRAPRGPHRQDVLGVRPPDPALVRRQAQGLHPRGVPAARSAAGGTGHLAQGRSRQGRHRAGRSGRRPPRPRCRAW
ncbi:hypothetical protein IHE61_27190 [Streptomyces sp. GKU 257-1]|nr:hypothetical protein [Streptomyces sp. GKU 257-1]